MTGAQESDPQGPPQVYVPQTAPSPAYEEYADPAVAHGWQNAYDETSELPRVPGTPEGGWEPGADGRAARRSHRRRDNRRRALLAAGALGTVSVAALVAGFGFSSDSASSDADVKKDPARSAKDDSGASTDPSATPSTASMASSDTPGTTASPDATDPKTPKDSDKTSAAASPTSPSTTSQPTTTTPADTGPGNSGSKPGQGSTKGPK
ncbi:hypothetical protein [Streptomyces cupreus]|uniref:Uncharacterized protein n=1 Tax=Streptomyces cupreus TaxID=2759956 RepID=A0A7X1IYN3_9ACTN|nr:hypothetical protein [Streptomyces cupreus]MBC2900809.1 hypothetical protein [Streptomyces cupreus]